MDLDDPFTIYNIVVVMWHVQREKTTKKLGNSLRFEWKWRLKEKVKIKYTYMT